MVVSGSPKRWDRWHSPSPNWQGKYHLYTTYSPCLLGGLYNPYHPLQEPEKSIEFSTNGSRGICVWSWNSAPEVEDYFFLKEKGEDNMCLVKKLGGARGGWDDKYL